MKTAQEQTIVQETINNIKANKVNKKNPEEDTSVFWHVKKQDKNLLDWKTNKKSRVVREKIEEKGQSTDTCVTNCINVLTKYSNYNLQEKIDHIEEMEESRKICLAALLKSQYKIKHQPSREIVRILITQLENKHIEEQIFKLKQEAEKEENKKPYTPSLAEPLTKNKKHLENIKNNKDLPQPIKATNPNKSEQHLTNKNRKNFVPQKNPPSLAWKSQQTKKTTKNKASISQRISMKQQKETKSQKWKDNQKTQASDQKSARQTSKQKSQTEESQTNSINTGPIKTCITSLFNHPNKDSESCSTALNQLIKNNISEKRITPTYILVQNSGIPILISETNLETTQTSECNKEGTYNETIKKPLAREELMYRLMAHLDQITNL